MKTNFLENFLKLFSTTFLTIAMLLSFRAMNKPKLTGPESKIFVRKFSSFNEVIYPGWKKFPIHFKISNELSVHQIRVIKNEMSRVNSILGDKIFTYEVVDKEKTGLAHENSFFIQKSIKIKGRYSNQIQALTTLVSTDSTINYAHIKFSEFGLDKRLDFATLVRHELAHSIGFDHNSSPLMRESLPPFTKRDWNFKHLSLWKKTFYNKNNVLLYNLTSFN